MQDEPKRLTPDHEATLRHLRREVDMRQEIVARKKMSHMDSEQKLYHARQRLREFTSSLRENGYLI